MSWHSGTLTNTNAGSFLTILDAVLPTNSAWSIFDDAAGTNAKVYRYSSTKITYYIKVDNNYTGYAIIELWESWDSGSHT